MLELNPKRSTVVRKNVGQLPFPTECNDDDIGSLKKSRKGLKRLLSCAFSVEVSDPNAEESEPALSLRVRSPPTRTSGLEKRFSPGISSEDLDGTPLLPREEAKELEYEFKLGFGGEKKASQPVENDERVQVDYSKPDFNKFVDDIPKDEQLEPMCTGSTQLVDNILTVKIPVENEHNVAEETSATTESTADCTPEVKLAVKEITHEDKKEIKQDKRKTFRQKVGIRKRNVFWISDPLAPPTKQRKKTHRCHQPAKIKQDRQKIHRITPTPTTVKPKTLVRITKRRNITKKNVRLIVTRCKITQKPTRSILKKNKNTQVKTNSEKQVSGPPSLNSCSDSGLGSGNSYNSGSYGSTGNSSHDSGGDSGGSGAQNSGESNDGGGSGGGGGKESDDEDKRPLSSGDVEMEEEEEEEDEPSEDEPMPSQDNSSMCCSDVKKESTDQDIVNWQELVFQQQDLRHSCYCVNDNCLRPMCHQIKKECNHNTMEHKRDSCARCIKFTICLKDHASTCMLTVCRVPNCAKLRTGTKATANASPTVPQQGAVNPPTYVPRGATNMGPMNWFQPFPYYNTGPHYQPFLQPSGTPQCMVGQVIFRNPPNIFGMLFQEGTDYNKTPILCGKGRNGEVFKVCTNSRRQMVVKETGYIIRPEEINVYKSMGDHENIVKTHCITFRTSEGKANIFMEQCDMSVKDYLDHKKQSGETMSVGEAMFYWTQVLMAVEHLHGKGIIHKDVKAKNVLLCESPGQGELMRAKLADFDSAMKLEQEFTLAGLPKLGTEGFAAPEVLNEQPHGRPADIYSLGCFLLELMGATPSSDSQKKQQQVEALGVINEKLKDVVKCCVQGDYTERPTARDLLNLEFVKQYHKIPEEV